MFPLSRTAPTSGAQRAGRSKKALELSWRASQTLGDDHIDTQHLLLGLLAEGEGSAVRTLNAIGADPARLRKAILDRAARLP
jgi:ATP-dependent Clp protease ATP-binding subunit ClpC